MAKKTIKRYADQDFIFNELNVHPVLQKVYARRGVKSMIELERNLDKLLPYHSLLNIDAAAKLLATSIYQDEKILIVGDFDADGATSTALACRALQSFGAKNVDFLVPNRFTFGYGLTPELVQHAESLKPQLIVTVDNGIASFAGVEAAKKCNIKVLVTDHHLAASTLPAADVIVNPNQAGDPFQSKSIAGVGVIFYVMLALRRLLQEEQWFQTQKIPEPNMSHFLDLVALGTVADVVSLDQNNRILVYQGLRRIRAGQCVPGITALLKASNRDPSRIVATDLGFAVAPRLNAAGRLDDMAFGIECLLTNDERQAQEMATVLSQLNDERREIEEGMQEQALQFIQGLQSLEENALPKGLCLFDEKWHQGVIGILASRMKEKFHRPVIAFALANEKEIKGSARSVAGVHIRDVLAEIDVEHPGLIDKFGGHAMAAGLSLSREVYEKFSRLFDEKVSRHLSDDALQQCILSDGELRPEECNLAVAEVIREAGPWGQAFPEPLFDGRFEIIEQRLVGSKHLKMVLQQAGKMLDAIAFNVDLNLWPNYRCEFVHAVYRLDVNEFRGRRSLQLMIEHLEV